MPDMALSDLVGDIRRLDFEATIDDQCQSSQKFHRKDAMDTTEIDQQMKEIDGHWIRCYRIEETVPFSTEREFILKAGLPTVRAAEEFEELNSIPVPIDKGYDDPQIVLHDPGDRLLDDRTTSSNKIYCLERAPRSRRAMATTQSGTKHHWPGRWRIGSPGPTIYSIKLNCDHQYGAQFSTERPDSGATICVCIPQYLTNSSSDTFEVKRGSAGFACADPGFYQFLVLHGDTEVKILSYHLEFKAPGLVQLRR
jgi:hypothetical protein